tara:strand:- start:72 stop:536 length:465 start_codon:yes stop_codon:yes gene_type:complete
MRSSVRRRKTTKIAASLTPMIDVTFLLIVFFVLVSHIVDLDQIDMHLPNPKDHQASHPDQKSRLVLNVEPGYAGTCVSYRIGAASWPCGKEGAEGLRREIFFQLQQNLKLQINVRADRKTQYRYIQPVLNAIRGAAADKGIGKVRVNLMVSGAT